MDIKDMIAENIEIIIIILGFLLAILGVYFINNTNEHTIFCKNLGFDTSFSQTNWDYKVNDYPFFYCINISTMSVENDLNEYYVNQ